MKEEQNSQPQPANRQTNSTDQSRAGEQPAEQTGGQNAASDVEEAARTTDDHEGEGTGARAGEYS